MFISCFTSDTTYLPPKPREAPPNAFGPSVVIFEVENLGGSNGRYTLSLSGECFIMLERCILVPLLSRSSSVNHK